MIKAVHTALAARRDALSNKDEQGFTLIELLVVVIIIGILAAIAIPVYLGVQANAKDASVQTDLANFKTAIVSMESNNGSLPTAVQMMANPGAGPYVTINKSYDGTSPLSATALKAGATWGQYTNAIAYNIGSNNHFCLEGESDDKNYWVSDQSGVSTTSCLATYNN